MVKPVEKPRTVLVQARLVPWLADKLKAEAKRQQRSLAKQLVVILQTWVRDGG